MAKHRTSVRTDLVATHHPPENVQCTYTLLQVKLSPRGVHLLPLVEPFILPELRVERPLLQPSHLQRESRTEFLQTRLGLPLTGIGVYLPRALLEDVAMMSNEYEIALIVKRRNLPSLELGVVWEEAAEEPTCAMAEAGGESVKVQLRHVRRRRTVVGHVRGRYDVGDLEECRGSAEAIPFRRTQVRYQHAVANLALLGKHDEVGEFPIRAEGAYLLDRVRLAGVVIQLGDEPHEVGYEVE